MPKSRPIRVGVLGLGRAGWHIHVAAVRNDPRYRVVAVADGLRDRREQAVAELGCAGYGRPRDLINDVKADLIVNATPTPLHASLTIDALKAGMHAVVEKPVARNMKEGRSMVRAATAARKKLFMHHNYRYQPMVKHFREVLDSGILGDIFEIKINVAAFTRRNDWQTLKRNQGGLLGNHGTHYIDWVMQMMGAPVKDVFSDLKLVSDSGDAEDHVRVLLRARNGCIADFHLSTATNAELPMVLLLGTCGTLTSDGAKSTIRYFDPRKVKELPVLTGAAEGRAYGNADKLPWRKKTMPSTSRDKSTFYDNVYDVLRNRKKMVVTPESVLQVLAVMEKARRPIATWRPAYGRK